MRFKTIPKFFAFFLLVIASSAKAQAPDPTVMAEIRKIRAITEARLLLL